MKERGWVETAHFNNCHRKNFSFIVNPTKNTSTETNLMSSKSQKKKIPSRNSPIHEKIYSSRTFILYLNLKVRRDLVNYIDMKKRDTKSHVSKDLNFKRIAWKRLKKRAKAYVYYCAAKQKHLGRDLHLKKPRFFSMDLMLLASSPPVMAFLRTPPETSKNTPLLHQAS